MLQLKNKLGDIRAESDLKMLDAAFVETPEYKGVVETRDFNFIVGRRGSGKSAIKYTAVRYLSDKRGNWIFDIENQGHDVLLIHSILNNLKSEYKHLNYIMRVVTRISIRLELIKQLYEYYKKKKLSLEKEISDIYSSNKDIINLNFYAKCAKILTSAAAHFQEPLSIPHHIANQYQLEHLDSTTEKSLEDVQKNAIFFFDNLDEAWTPQPLETSIIGGLANTASKLKDQQSYVHIYIFSRDNMFRAIATLDTDFTRNIEGAVLRLKWDDSSLFHLVTERIKFAFSINAENNVKVWNRVAKNELSGRPGFKICTNKTLYRPRDILSLLNQSFLIATKDNREEIIQNDVELAAKSISQSRLTDLSNEYKEVFPSLVLLIDSLKNGFSPYSFADVLEIFREVIDSSNNSTLEIRDFGIFNAPEDCFLALYSIGFIGIDIHGKKQITFCHDGATSSSFDSISNTTKVWVHPCYWEALSLTITEDLDIISSVYDDYSAESYKKDMVDLRIKQIGSVITDIGNIPEGKEGASQYEEWILRAVKILFHEDIENPELHANGQSVARRDIIGTINAGKGFWNRINKDYQCRQIVFEAKNYGELTLDDIRQISDYLSGSYGRFGIIIPRRKQEALSTQELNWIRDCWARHSKMIFILPHSLLVQCIGKQRAKNRYDYTERTLSKRLDTFERNYISIKSG